ncbi:MAG: undecaprenyldiphospho-muramoylpentapeptide beta-N-acetylglucosaminyltransferase [Bacteroidia bacterium]
MPINLIIAGGGTGGHIFPAVAIAREVKRQFPDANILFVGAKGGMEMTVVPKQGFEIQDVWISGLQRQLSVKNIVRNLLFPVKLIVSLFQANSILRKFKPDVVVGVGGYASGPMGRVAAGAGIPLVICEQNAFPGLVNRWLSKYAKRILLGNEAAAKYFPKEKVKVTGNPIREFARTSKAEGAAAFDLDPAKPVLLSLGGSLGALSINNALQQTVSQALEADVQVIWQTGKRYISRLEKEVPKHRNLRMSAFIDDMAAAYGAADLVLSRAGGSTISELIALEKPAILVPSPNVSEDHQTKNARSLSDQGAALLVPDSEANQSLIPEALDLLHNQEKLQSLKNKLQQFEKHKAAEEIVAQILALNNSNRTNH